MMEWEMEKKGDGNGREKGNREVGGKEGMGKGRRKERRKGREGAG